MQEVQKTQFENYQGADHFSGDAGYPRFLEGPNGVGLYFCGQPLARVLGDARVWEFTIGGEPYRVILVSDMMWEWASAMRLLQGDSLQGLLGPAYFVVDFSNAPIYSPVPKLYKLAVVEALFPVPMERVGEVSAKLYTYVRPALSSLN